MEGRGEGKRPRITVTKDGPYRVEGGLPLLRTAIVETGHGEPIAWDEGPRFEAGQTYELCRCGNSSRKPFCDSTHEKVPFDGTEIADRAPSASRRDVFVGEGVVMTDDRSICSQAGFCGDRFTKVWQMIDEASDPEVRDRLTRMVKLCPSGRLEYSVSPDPTPVEPAFDPSPSIGIEPNGPVWVRGGVEIVSADGAKWETRNRLTLCRCGRSHNKPFCDGSHRVVRFTDPALPT